MASGRITIAVGLETRDVAKGAKDAEKALSNLDDAVGDAGKGGVKDLNKLEDELKAVQKQSKRTGDDLSRNMDDGFKSMGDGTKAFKEEAVQNFSEVASSFSGDVSEMADGIQGLTGGLASALTPGIGIPVAILGAAAAAFFASWQEAAEQSKQQVSDMYADFTESGATFVSEEFIGAAIKDIQQDTDKWNDALKTSKDTGIDIGVVLRAMAGDQEAIAAVHGKYVKQRDDEIRKIRESGRGLEDQQTAIDAVNTKFGESVDWITQIQRNTQTAADKAAAFRDAMGGAAGNAQTAADRINSIRDRNISLGIAIDDSVYEAWARKKRYLDVIVNPVTGTAGGSSPYKQPI